MKKQISSDIGSKYVDKLNEINKITGNKKYVLLEIAIELLYDVYKKDFKSLEILAKESTNG